MLPRVTHLFGCTRSKPSQGSVPVGLALASDFGFCFLCKVGSSLVLRRPIEITAFSLTTPTVSRDFIRIFSVHRHTCPMTRGSRLCGRVVFHLCHPN